MTSAVETYLANLNGAAPDMAELHRLGVPLSEAVAMCAAAHKPPEPAPVVAEPVPEARTLNLDCYKPPVASPKIAAHQEPVHELSALSLLHTLSQMTDSGRADITLLVQQGFSPHTAAELCNLIRCAHPFNVSPVRSS